MNEETKETQKLKVGDVVYRINSTIKKTLLTIKYFYIKLANIR